MLFLVGGIIITQTDATLADLVLPLGALGDDERFVFGFATQRTIWAGRIISYGIITAMSVLLLVVFNTRHNFSSALMIVAGLWGLTWTVSKFSEYLTIVNGQGKSLS